MKDDKYAVVLVIEHIGKVSLPPMSKDDAEQLVQDFKDQCIMHVKDECGVDLYVETSYLIQVAVASPSAMKKMEEKMRGPRISTPRSN